MAAVNNFNALQEEVTKKHQVMIDVLQSRLMRLDATLTFWKKQDFSQLLSYLLRTDDDSLFVDVLPHITKRITEDDKNRQKMISLGTCLDLLPVLDRLLYKKFETYICVSLDFLLAMIKRWYLELRDKKSNKDPNLNSSLSLPDVYLKLMSMSERLEHLSHKKGNVGKKSKIVLQMIRELE